MSRIGKSAHIKADLGNDYGGGCEVHPERCTGGESNLYTVAAVWQVAVQQLQLPIQVRQVLHGFCQQPAKVVAVETLERADQLGSFVLQAQLLRSRGDKSA
jgi:hypothetical protein